MGRYHKVFDKSGASSLTDTPILETSYVCPESGILRIIVSAVTIFTLEMTFDGTSYQSLEKNSPADTLKVFDIPVQLNDKVNFRTDDNETLNVFHAILDSG